MNALTMPRRRLLQAGLAGLVAAGRPPIASGAALTDLGRAQAWVAALAGPGINIERSRVASLTYNNVVLNQSLPFPAWLKSQGVGYVRNFFGWSPSADVIGLGRLPALTDLTPYFRMIERLTSAGIPVRFDFTDVIQVTDVMAPGTFVWAWLAASAHYASNFGFSHPGMICFGAFNEPVDDGANGTLWNPYLLQAFKTIRKFLPSSTWTLSMQHNYWNDANHLSQAVLASDQNVIYDCHYYPYSQPTANGAAAVQTEWAGVAATMAAWSAANGNVPLLLGEIGLWNPNDQPYGGGALPPASDWAPAVAAASLGAGAYRPAAWATTDAGDGNAPPINLNSGASTAVWSSDVTAAYQTAAAFIQSQPYFVPAS